MVNEKALNSKWLETFQSAFQNVCIPDKVLIWNPDNPEEKKSDIYINHKALSNDLSFLSNCGFSQRRKTSFSRPSNILQTDLHNRHHIFCLKSKLFILPDPWVTEKVPFFFKGNKHSANQFPLQKSVVKSWLWIIAYCNTAHKDKQPKSVSLPPKVPLGI